MKRSEKRNWNLAFIRRTPYFRSLSNFFWWRLRYKARIVPNMYAFHYFKNLRQHIPYICKHSRFSAYFHNGNLIALRLLPFHYSPSLSWFNRLWPRILRVLLQWNPSIFQLFSSKFIHGIKYHTTMHTYTIHIWIIHILPRLHFCLSQS